MLWKLCAMLSVEEMSHIYHKGTLLQLRFSEIPTDPANLAKLPKLPNISVNHSQTVKRPNT